VRRAGLLALAAAAALALPASAWAHAALLRTDPVASRTIDAAPPEVRLTYSEPVEPRFAIVSVTDATGRQVTSGEPVAAPGSAQTVVTPLRRVGEGWYLVFWRVISADGHPVRGAFTFAIGPNPGPPPVRLTRRSRPITSASSRPTTRRTA
jgi:copper transport protein